MGFIQLPATDHRLKHKPCKLEVVRRNSWEVVKVFKSSSFKCTLRQKLLDGRVTEDEMRGHVTQITGKEIE
jgi:hypothetical protein